MDYKRFRRTFEKLYYGGAIDSQPQDSQPQDSQPPDIEAAMIFSVK